MLQKIQNNIIPIATSTGAVFTSLSIIYWWRTGNYETAFELYLVANITLLTTLVGVFTALEIENKVRRKEKENQDKRIMGFMLGLIESELRANEQLLDHIYKNKVNPEFLDTVNFWAAMGVAHNKFLGISEFASQFKHDSYIAAQSSGNITTLNSDDVLNKLMTAYYDLYQVKMTHLTVKAQFATSLRTYSEYKDSTNFSSTQIARRAIVKNLEINNSVLDRTVKSVGDAISTVSDSLESLNIKILPPEDEDLQTGLIDPL